MIAALGLPSKLEPVAVIAFGWPDEEKELCGRTDRINIAHHMDDCECMWNGVEGYRGRNIL